MADRSRRLSSLPFAVVLALHVAPVLAGAPCDLTLIFADGFESGDRLAWEASTQIALARAAPDGAAAIDLSGVTVTYVRPAVGSDPAGFFVQAAQTGPALFVAVDPVTLVPVPVAGDVLFFSIDTMATASGARQATAVSGFGRSAQGRCLEPLTQNVSAATDLVSGLDGYDSELISLSSASVVGAFAAAGTGHVAAQIDTAGISGDSNLRLRLPTTLQSSTAIDQGCSFDLTGTPLWRSNATAQPSAWRAEDLAVTSCPAPTVVSAVATSATTVAITIDRPIDPVSVTDAATQVSFDNGLLAVSGIVNQNVLTVTTTAQTGGESYTVTVASSVLDVFGNGIGVPNQAMFTGYQTPATLRINELNASILSSCDLVELRVVSGGSMNGIFLKERDVTVVTFSDFQVAAGDFILVHFNGGNATCNPGSVGNETTSVTEIPSAVNSTNFDTAFDWYSADGGFTNTDNVLTLYRSDASIADAVLLVSSGCLTVTTNSETQAAEVAGAGEWEQVGGGVPAGGFIDQDFCDNAVTGLNGTGTTTAGDTIGRTDDLDTNTKAGWGTAGPTWGALNTGQAP